jgi:hypothetical protein
MAKLLEITSKINELDTEYDALFEKILELNARKLKILDEKAELVEQKKILEQCEMLETDRKEVLGKLKFLSKLVNSQNVYRINLTVPQANVNNIELISFDISTEIHSEGIKYNIYITSNRLTIRKMIVDSILITPYIHPEHNYNEYWYSKAEHSGQKFFKDFE